METKQQELKIRSLYKTERIQITKHKNVKSLDKALTLPAWPGRDRVP